MRKRKKSGGALIFFGLLLLAGAVGLLLYNLNRELEAGQESDEAVLEFAEHLSDQDANSRAPDENPTLGAVTIDGQDYIGVLSIPVLNLQLPVQMEWSYPNLRISPCRMTGAPWTDDLVILAHNYRTHFGRLNELESGAEVTLTLSDGSSYAYRVVKWETVIPTDVEQVTASDYPLTLFTCTLGGRTRVVVYCEWAETH